MNRRPGRWLQRRFPLQATALQRLTSAPGLFEFWDFRATSLVTLSGSDVESVAGRKSGLVASYNTSRPAYADGIATFDGVSDMLVYTNASLSAFGGSNAIWTIFVGAYTSDVTTVRSAIAFANNAANDQFIWLGRSSVDQAIRRNVSTATVGGSAPGTAAQVYSHTYNGTSIASWINSVASCASTASAIAPSGINNFSMGGLLRLAGQLQPCGFAMRGVLIGTGALTTTQRNQLETAARSYYGV